MIRDLNNRVFLWILLSIFVILVAGLLGLRAFLLNEVTVYYRNSLAKEAEILEHALHHAMMQTDFPMAEQVLVNASLQSETSAIRLISKQGMVLASSVPDESGVQLNKMDGTCEACHATTSGEGRLTHVKLADGGGNGDIIITANRLDNTVACRTCHKDDGGSLGVLLTEHYSGSLDAWIARLNYGFIGGGACMLVLLGFVSARVLRMGIGAPLDQLAAGTQLDQSTQREDVIGAIARRIQLSETESNVLKNEAYFQRRSFDALLSLFEALDTNRSVQDMMHKALKTMQTVTRFSSVAMRVYEEKQGCFRLVAQDGMSPQMVQELECIPDDRGFQAEVKIKKYPICTSNLATDPRLGGASVLREGYKSLACVPFLVADQVVGSMELASKDAHEWDDDEKRWLALVGRSIGFIIHHVRLTEHLRGMTVLEERNRVAQEIHDGLAGLLGSLRIWAEEARLSAEKQEYDQMEAAIEKVETTARYAYASLREEMLGLRNIIIPGEDLQPIITEYLNRFQQQWGIEARLEVAKTDTDGRQAALSPAAEIQLLRIIQEGLTNIRRHASAQSVVVRIEEGREAYRVSILDNGRGFDPDRIPSEHLGLRIMQERALSVGGNVRVHSVEGEGTTVDIVLPRQPVGVRKLSDLEQD